MPLVGGVLGVFLRVGTLGGLAQANLRDGVRRSASTAAPLLVLVALVLGLSGTLSTISGAERGELVRDLAGDVVVESASPLPGDAPSGPARTFVRFAPGADWIAASSSEQDDTNSGIMAVLMGLAGIYALIAVINAVVIAAAERRAEFAAARATGLRRGQVVLMALIESGAVAVIGLVLGCLAAAGTRSPASARR